MSPTRLLMAASALVLGLLGLIGSFVPDHLLEWIGTPAGPAAMLLVQVIGALYLGFAALNWTARFSLIGGVYSRPVVLGNLLHFVSAGLAMLKAIGDAPELAPLWPLAAVYAVFAVCFGVVLFRHPVPAAAAGSAGPG